MGVISLLVFDYVFYGFHRVVGISLCIAWVVSFCWYLIVYCIGFIVLLIFECVAWVLSVC